MCKTSDLVVMVVDTNKHELKKSCESLEHLGINKIICVESYTDAIENIRISNDIDIVIADFDIDAGKSLGLLLCGAMKKEHPSICFILVSRRFCGSVILDSLPIADDILKKNDSDLIEHMPKWLELVKLRNSVKDLFNANSRPHK